MSYRFFIDLQYNGKNYHGWQVQPNSKTIQGELDEKLSLVLKEPLHTIGAGRTDAGVHARHFVAHFDCNNDISMTSDKIKKKLNSFLSEDIVINNITKVRNTSHARFDALSREYKYYISLKKDVFRKDYLWHVFWDLDIELMQKGAAMLKNYNDFTSFSKLHTDVKTNNCIIEHAKWEKDDYILTFSIKADRFLRNMVRAIVGTLVLLGRNKILVTDFQDIIESKNRSIAGESAPAQGLFLEEILYPSSLYKP